MRSWLFLISIGLGLGLLSCRDKVICPAYQSAYMLDPVQRDQFFSLFEGDSIPKKGRWKMKKNKNGTMVLVAYTTRTKQIRTVKMQNVLPLEPYEEMDTVLLAYVDPLNMADSVGLDSASLFARRSTKGVKYNYDQLWYEENIEELTREDGVDPKTIFSKKQAKKEEEKPTEELSDSELDTDDPNDFEFESFEEMSMDSLGSETVVPILDKDENQPPVKEDDTEDDGLDDF